MSDHPDSEALSAALDGEDEAAAAHAATCPECQGRLAALRAVRDAVGAAVRPPDPEAVDAAVARAVSAADEWETSAAASAVPTDGPAAWPPAGEAGYARRASAGKPEPVVGGDPAPAGRWRLWITGSAAAAVLAIVVLAAVLATGGSGGREDTALSGGPVGNGVQESSPPFGGVGAAPTFAGRPDGVTVQELGDVPDVAALRSRLSVGTSAAAARATTDAAAAPPPAAAAVGTRVCEIEARTARPDLPAVVYVANLRFQGTPAVALGFAPSPGATPFNLLVLAPGEGCRVLAETTIP